MAFSTTWKSGVGCCLSHWLEVYCNINNIICLTAVLPPGISNYDSRKVEDCSTSRDLSVLKFIKPDTGIQNHPLWKAVPFPIMAEPLVALTDCCDLVAVSQFAHYDTYSNNPFSREQRHQGQHAEAEFKLSQFLCLELWCMNSLTAGIVLVCVGEQAQICCQKVATSEALTLSSSPPHIIYEIHNLKKACVLKSW